MAETPAEVRRDIELTRQRMSGTLEELEQKLNVKQMISDHPWPALAVAFGAGVLLAGTKADAKAAAATAAAAQGAGPKLGAALDNVVANLVTVATQAVQGRVDGWVNEIAGALGGAAGGNGVPRSAPTPSDVSYGVGPSDIVPGKGPVTAPKDVPRAD
jgi:hypothetical protein